MAHQQLHILRVAEELLLFKHLLDIVLVDVAFLLQINPSEEIADILAQIINVLSDRVQF